MRCASNLATALFEELEKQLRTNDYDKASTVFLALLVNASIDEVIAHKAVQHLFERHPAKILLNVLEAPPKIRPADKHIKTLINSTKYIREHKFTAMEIKDFETLKISQMLAYEVAKYLFASGNDILIKTLLSPHIMQGNGELDLYFAFICKEIKDYKAGIQACESIITNHKSNADLVDRAKLCIAEIYVLTMRAHVAVETISGIRGSAHISKRNALQYSYTHYSPNFSLEFAQASAKAWEESLPPIKNRPRKLLVPATAFQKPIIRVGLISRSFKTHPVGWMVSGLLVEAMSSSTIEFQIFDLDKRSDFIAKTIQEVSGPRYHNLTGMADFEILSRLDAENLDILLDLEGHQPHNVMPLYRGLDGPLLVKWIGGLVNSTFLSFFDAIVTDQHQSPIGTEQNYSEVVVRLKNCYVTYTPPPYRVEPEPPPYIQNNYVTFGSFNNAIKLNEPTVAVWAQILHQVDDSKIILKDKGFDAKLNQSLILEWFDKNGISKNRIQLIGGSDHQRHLETHNFVDICLDPIPYSGGLCTLEALSMNTPVISLAGRVIAHRHSVTHLTNAGVPELIAYSQDEYIEKAVSLANDRKKIQDYSETLRRKLISSSLLKHREFLEDFENKMRETLRSLA